MSCVQLYGIQQGQMLGTTLGAQRPLAAVQVWRTVALPRESPSLEALETCRMWHLATWLCGRLGSVRLDSAHPAPWHEPTLNSRGLTSTRAAASKPIHQQPGRGSSRPAVPSARTALALQALPRCLHTQILSGPAAALAQRKFLSLP